MSRGREQTSALAPEKSNEEMASPFPQRIGRYRWVICALLFFAATINYIDRQVIGILKPTLQTEIGWTEVEYSWIVFWFQTAYAVGLLAVGRVMDWLGTRRGSAWRSSSGAWPRWDTRWRGA